MNSADFPSRRLPQRRGPDGRLRGDAGPLRPLPPDAEEVLLRSTYRPATCELYRRAWSGFADFCEQAQLSAWPIDAEAVARFVVEKTRTSERQTRTALGALGLLSRPADPQWLLREPPIYRVLPQIQTHPPEATPVLSPPEVDAVLRATASGSLEDLRARALFLVGYQGGLNAKQITRLDMSQLAFSAAGLVLDVSVPPRTVPRHAPDAPCAVRALEDWLRAASIDSGFVFRELTPVRDEEGKRIVSDLPLTPATARRLLWGLGVKALEKGGRTSIRTLAKSRQRALLEIEPNAVRALGRTGLRTLDSYREAAEQAGLPVAHVERSFDTLDLDDSSATTISLEAAFHEWRRRAGRPVRLTPADAKAYLVELAEAGKAAATLRSVRWALDRLLRQSGAGRIHADPQVAALIAERHLESGGAGEILPCTREELERLLDAAAELFPLGTELRDRALLLWGFFSPLELSQLLSLRRPDIPKPVRRRPLTIQVGGSHPREVTFAPNLAQPHLCPIEAICDWDRLLGQTRGGRRGPLFTGTTRTGRVSVGRGPQVGAWGSHVRRLMDGAGLAHQRLSFDSLRQGHLLEQIWRCESIQEAESKLRLSRSTIEQYLMKAARRGLPTLPAVASAFEARLQLLGDPPRSLSVAALLGAGQVGAPGLETAAELGAEWLRGTVALEEVPHFPQTSELTALVREQLARPGPHREGMSPELERLLELAATYLLREGLPISVEPDDLAYGPTYHSGRANLATAGGDLKIQCGHRAGEKVIDALAHNQRILLLPYPFDLNDTRYRAFFLFRVPGQQLQRELLRWT